MKIFYLKILMLLFVAFAINAQPARNGMKRIEQLKKLKMLEVLDLEEDKADAFLIKYNAAEDKIKEAHDEFKLAAEDLKLSIEREEEPSVLEEKTLNLIAKQNVMHQARENKFAELKTVLSETQFAKLVLFEIQFHERVRELMIKGRRQTRGMRGN